MKRQKSAKKSTHDVNRKLDDVSLLVEALKTPVSERTKFMLNVLKDYVKHHVPLMEHRYCNNDDYTWLAENLQYKFIQKGHYAVRQGDHGMNVHFII